jgi:hypothetical protein
LISKRLSGKLSINFVKYIIISSAFEDSGKRLVVFEAGGVIDLQLSTITVTNSYLTVAGHTAPGPGITLPDKL